MTECVCCFIIQMGLPTLEEQTATQYLGLHKDRSVDAAIQRLTSEWEVITDDDAV